MKLPRDVSGSDVVRALGRLGFIQTKQEGSHIRLVKGPLKITVPNHKTILPKTLQIPMRPAIRTCCGLAGRAPMIDVSL